MKNISIIALVFLTFFLSCEEKEENPSIRTEVVKAISAKRFYLKASVPEKGNIPISDYGFVYYVGTETSQSGTEFKVSLGEKITADTFSTEITLTYISNYYSSSGLKLFAKAYVTNEKGTMYAKPVSATLLLSQVQQVVPNYGKTGDTIVIRGTNFDPIVDNNSVLFNTTPAKVIESSPTYMRVIVPAAIISNNYDGNITLKVVNGNLTSDYSTVFYLTPSATSFSPNHGTWGTNVTIYGNSLYGCNVYFNDFKYSSYNSQTNSISVSIPSSVYYKSFKLYVEKNGQKIEVPGGTFNMDPPKINSTSPQKCLPGNAVTLNVANHHPSGEYNKLHLGNQVISSSNSYTSNLSFTIPASVPKGTYTAYYSNMLDTVKLPGSIEIVYPEITGISPSSGYMNTKYTITGKNLYYGYSGTYVYFDNYTASGSVIDSFTVKGSVPSLEPDSYSIYLYVGNIRLTCPTKFTILAPKLTSITPATGAANSSVIISGEGFGTNLNNVSVYFGNLNASLMTISNTEINVKVPSGVTSGRWMVKVNINGYSIPGSLTFDVP